MDIFTGIIVYLLIWWVVLFTVLPWGNKMTDTPVEGEVASAPINPNLKKKFIITSLISLVLLVIIVTLIELDFIDFRALGYALLEEKNI